MNGSDVSPIGGCLAMGALIRRLRTRDHELSQAELAGRAEMSENHLGKLERGEVVDPGISAISRLSGVLAVSVAEPVLAFASPPGAVVSAESSERPQALGGRSQESALRGGPAALGIVIQDLRVRRRMTQAGLARVSGLAVTTINELEAGRKIDPRLRTLIRVAAGLGDEEGAARYETLARLARAFAGETLNREL